MIRIGDRDFLFHWQTIRAATQPGPEATVWQAGGVRWCRHRYSHAAPDHTVIIEVHRLDHAEGAERWSIMVVAEHWWDEHHKSLRDRLWAAHLSGPRPRIVEWMERQTRASGNGRRS